MKIKRIEVKNKSFAKHLDEKSNSKTAIINSVISEYRKIAFNKENPVDLFSQLMKVLTKEKSRGNMERLLPDVRSLSGRVYSEWKKSKASRKASLMSDLENKIKELYEKDYKTWDDIADASGFFSSDTFLDMKNDLWSKNEEQEFDKFKKINYVREIRLPQKSLITDEMVKFIVEQHIKELREDDRGIVDLRKFLTRNREFLNKFKSKKKIEISKKDSEYKAVEKVLQKINNDYKKMKQKAEQEASNSVGKTVKDILRKLG